MLLITAIAAGAGGFMGAFGFWLITKIEAFLSRPRVVIEYGTEYPFKSKARFEDGREGEFVRVRIRNEGRTAAENCRCFVRRVALKSGGKETKLPFDELMLTNWVPREANATVLNIPPRMDFLADVAHTWQPDNDFRLMPVFMVQNRNVEDIFNHTGDFEMEFVVIGDYFKTARRTIKFRFEGKSLDLIPLL